MPAPKSSIQAAPLHFEHVPPAAAVPVPPQNGQETSNSTLGSVNGKELTRNRDFTLGPKNCFTKYSIVPVKSQKVMSGSTTTPSTWWRAIECVASEVSRRE